MLTAFDPALLRRRSIGYDPLLTFLRETAEQPSANFPYHNVIQLDDDSYRLELALAGYSEADIDITCESNVLTITGRRPVEKPTEYLHRGIALREFTREFRLGDYIEVRGADLKDGILTVDLVRFVPEEKRPRQIPIGAKSSRGN